MTIDSHGIPTEGSEILFRIPSLGLVSHRVERDVIAVINEDEIVQLIVSRKCNRLLGNSLLKTSVTGESNHVVVKNGVIRSVETTGRSLSGKSVTHGIPHSLSKRTGGGFHAFGLVKLRMARSDRVKLSEVRDILTGDLETCEVEPTVDEH